jgi:hypothetical protein
MTYILMIDYVLSTGPKVLAHIIPTMERIQWLLGTRKPYLADNHFLSVGYSSLLSFLM